MDVVVEDVSIQGPVPPSLISALSQNALDSNEPPIKRRKVSKAVRYVISDEKGLSESGILVGYIPLVRVKLRFNFASSSDNNGIDTIFDAIDPSSRLPVLVEIKENRHDNTGPDTLDQSQINREACTLVAKTIDNQEDVFIHEFEDSQAFELLEQLQQATSLIPADRSPSLDPIACYQATIYRSSIKSQLFLEVVVLWKDSLEIPDIRRLEHQVLEVFGRYALQEHHQRPMNQENRLELREKLLGTPRGWSPREFYENVHVPPDTEATSADIEFPDVACELFPFQKRAVRWLLGREGMKIDNNGGLSPLPSSSSSLPQSFRPMKDADGQACYFSHLFMTITRDFSQWDDAKDSLKGGILAEEMGLGKTVELIALISLNRRQPQLTFDPNSLRDSGATLIITPPAILEQWKDEIHRHAPKLRVHHYTGIKRTKQPSDDLIVEEIADFDIVLTTYDVISREIHYVNSEPTRSLRHVKRFEKRKTPLVRISWWRVCLDEAQMIESGVSNAAKVARLIPRQNAWAVTGTPIRRNIDDLFGLLLFLHYQPYCFSNSLWKRLYWRFGPVLASIIQAIALRHNKDHVRNELHLPPQKRVVITVPFTAVEEQYYSQLFEQMCYQSGLDESGSPLRADWDPDNIGTVEKMRSWLIRLRQTCLHPELSGGNRRALRIGNGPLRTVDDVLEAMLENTDISIRTEERALLLSQLRRGQLLETAKRREESLSLWQAALEHSTRLVEESREQLRLLKTIENGVSKDNFKEKVDDSDGETEDTDKNSRVGQCRLKLRAALEVQHIAVFFTANAYYQIKSDPNRTQPDSEEFKSLEKKEEEGYETAKLIRQEMLTDISQKVKRHMRKIKEKKQKNQFVQIPKMKPHLYSRGVESYQLLNKFEDLCNALNNHAEQYNEWRSVMIDQVSQSLIDQEEDAELEGDEYERSTKHQDEMYVYMEALRSMYADRHDALTGQNNILISHEVRAGISQAQLGKGPSPQLFLSIMNTRSQLKPDPKLGSLRGIVVELRSLMTSLEWQANGGSARARAELEVVGEVLKNAGHMISEQLTVSSSLQREVEVLRDAMNVRLEYYRHLQQISDTVAPYDEENSGKPMDEALFASKLKQEEALEGKIASLKSKRRYFIHLRDDSGAEDSSRVCIICQSGFQAGVLTVCGHKYCSDCIGMWLGQNRTCPVCKKPLRRNDFHRITYNPQDLVAQEEEEHVKLDGGHSKNAIYTDISSGLLKEIKNIQLHDSFGTKIDTIARHIIWLRKHDPGAKSIIFSQYKTFLGILQMALERFGIVSSSVDNSGGIEKFKNDPAVECFLLHGKAQSSGLTLINATHVFLCEPLINTAIELQAIARVHRIGQNRPTTVWMYLVSGTVEESIYDLSVTRRLAHIIAKEKQEKKSHSGIPDEEVSVDALTETVIDSANSMELQGVLSDLMSYHEGGENVPKDDLWQCLFGNHARKEVNKRPTDTEREVNRFLRGEAASQRKEEATNG
ncbi:hypothetical protein N7495_006084 [Penicillium taxi]|uniref:uncharacterized protein n=1 Tax=Penicillium taxi TaxID=168475 RepID=UPI0025453DEE|nr:uncharacterized protein N7495_006084 [Penicillium taxi]KAJ5894393.1 hypothetical protein N7495_006084 [Penicillium taxi]